MNAPGEDRALADAIRRHEERVARDPESLAFAQLADLYRKAGRTGDAVACCRDGLRRWPHYTTARLILAKTLLAEGQLEPALAELSAILQTSPKDVQCHRLAAEVHRRAGRLDVAVGHLEKAVGLDPGDRESKALLSLLRADASAPGESAGLARILADETFATLSFGTVCLEQGLADEAALVLTRVVRRAPDNIEARERLEAALRARSRRRG
ncbi:MAG: tetratricopeptide repeat protein [Candidatus Rokuibacteriota bacterium]|nr:MAG: tetratricopeptide repeat protein [Candidatus Rokubacteria bacterium]